MDELCRLIRIKVALKQRKESFETPCFVLVASSDGHFDLFDSLCVVFQRGRAVGPVPVAESNRFATPRSPEPSISMRVSVDADGVDAQRAKIDVMPSLLRWGEIL